MNTTVESLDLLQRIIAAAQKPETEIYDSSGDAPFEPETQRIIGEVPVSLRGLHNLLHEIGITHTAATEAAHACERTFHQELEAAMKLDPRPEEMPIALKAAKEALEAAVAEAQKVDVMHSIIEGLFFTSLASHFPELNFRSYTLLSSWQVANVRRSNSIDSLPESIFDWLMGGVLISTLFINRE